ncbi:MAG: hypothetical protein H8D62_02580 [Bacteroidetes bacterium]|nr:hypothetical protein [Bacteroidota bacterium]
MKHLLIIFFVSILWACGNPNPQNQDKANKQSETTLESKTPDTLTFRIVNNYEYPQQQTLCIVNQSDSTIWFDLQSISTYDSTQILGVATLSNSSPNYLTLGSICNTKTYTYISKVDTHYINLAVDNTIAEFYTVFNHDFYDYNEGPMFELLPLSQPTKLQLDNYASLILTAIQSLPRDSTVSYEGDIFIFAKYLICEFENEDFYKSIVDNSQKDGSTAHDFFYRWLISEISNCHEDLFYKSLNWIENKEFIQEHIESKMFRFYRKNFSLQDLVKFQEKAYQKVDVSRLVDDYCETEYHYGRYYKKNRIDSTLYCDSYLILGGDKPLLLKKECNKGKLFAEEVIVLLDSLPYLYIEKQKKYNAPPSYTKEIANREGVYVGYHNPDATITLTEYFLLDNNKLTHWWKNINSSLVDSTTTKFKEKEKAIFDEIESLQSTYRSH